MAQQDPGMVAVRNILTRLCKRSGLSVERLLKTEIDVAPLLDLHAIAQYAQRNGVRPVDAVLPVVCDLAWQLSPTDRLIADTALSLGLLYDNPPVGIELDRLYASDLGERRAYLSEQWQLLHEWLRADHIPPAPTVRTLRASPERRAFTALAGLIAAESAPALRLLHPQPADDRADSPVACGVITVIGDAVIDHLYRTDHMPAEGISVRGRFEEHLGGKGLNRAVAAARLGLGVRLVTAVGDDEAGRRIMGYLRQENVDTAFVKVVPGGTTPVAAVIIPASGSAGTIGYVDDRVRLTREDLRDPAAIAAIVASDAVLLTFEAPVSAIAQAMAIVRAALDPPQLLVQPTPPVDEPQYLYRYLGAVDYLIGTRWELHNLVPDSHRAPDKSTVWTSSEAGLDLDTDISPHLRALGVGSVCAIEGFACSVRSGTVNVDIPRSRAAVLDDSPGSHAAFAAALACRLVHTRRPADYADFEWATAAMAATQSFGDVPDAMPLASEVDRIARLSANGSPGQL